MRAASDPEKELDHFLLVGSSYVDGLMEGQTLKKWKDDEVGDEWLEL